VVFGLQVLPFIDNSLSSLPAIFLSLNVKDNNIYIILDFTYSTMTRERFNYLFFSLSMLKNNIRH